MAFTDFFNNFAQKFNTGNLSGLIPEQLNTQGQRYPDKPPDESKYPLNIVHQYSGGHRLIIGNEQGKEAFQLYHPSGSSIVMYPDGSVAQMNIGKKIEYNKSGVTETTDENKCSVVNGHCSQKVGGGFHTEVSGDMGTICGGTMKTVAMNGMGISVKGGQLLINSENGINFNSSDTNKIPTPISMISNTMTFNCTEFTVNASNTIKLHVGDATITIDSSGVTVTGPAFTTKTGNSTIENNQDTPTSVHIS